MEAPSALFCRGRSDQRLVSVKPDGVPEPGVHSLERRIGVGGLEILDLLSAAIGGAFKEIGSPFVTSPRRSNQRPVTGEGHSLTGPRIAACRR